MAYHQAAERVDRGESIYDPHPPPGPHAPDAWYYLYPPFLASALALGPELPLVWFARVWLFIVLAAYWTYAACLCKLASGRLTFHGTLIAGALLGFVPGVMHALNMGQADTLMWAMLGVGLAFPVVRGGAFTAAALTKVTGVWALGVAMLREGRRTVAGAAIITFVAVAIAVIALGLGGFIESCREWFTYVMPVLAQGQFDPGNPITELRLPFGLGALELPAIIPNNLSISFLPIQLARWAGWWEYAGGPLPTAMRIYLTVAGVAAPVTAAWIFRRQPRDLHYALVITAALLFAPIFRVTNVPLLVAPVAILMRLRGTDQPGSGNRSGGAPLAGDGAATRSAGEDTLGDRPSK